MSETVWVVEQGEYSDYHIVGVFSSSANAQQIADAVNTTPYGDRATVAEWPLDPLVTQLQQGLLFYRVDMQRNGTVDGVELRGMDERDLAGEFEVYGNVLYATAWAKDEQHAIKITNEHRTRLIATGEWDAK